MVIHVGDCREVMAGMEPESVDAIVTDPPYGLSFMGKDWDAPRMLGQVNRSSEKGNRGVPSGPGTNSRGYADNDNASFQSWSESWAREAFRVLKPGGHLLAFGGSRTFHRLTVAIEDAGFEIRDCLSWLYGSGFPKSLDVSKAIDKMAPRAGMFDAFAAHFAERRKASGLSQKEIAAHFPSKTGGLTGCVWNWENGANVPTLAQWAILQPLLGLSDEWRPLIERIEAEREVIGKAEWSNSANHFVPGEDHTERVHLDITAPATPEAERWAGWGTALKPAWEPVIVARKPLVGTVAANVMQHGTGALNIAGTRIGHAETLTGGTGTNGKHAGWDRPWMHDGTPREGYRSTEGRWPANVALDEAAAEMLDAQSGERGGGMATRGASSRIYGGGKGFTKGTGEVVGYGDTGGASRFFYVAKASRRERNAGLDGMPERFTATMNNGIGAREHDPSDPRAHTANHHPTVKPITLMRWLVRLVTPPGGLILDPFAGSGSTGCAAVLEGFRFVGIEQDAEYAEIAERRIDYWSRQRPTAIQHELPLEGAAD